MNRKEYLEQLMQQSKYCECPTLSELLEKRKSAQTLEARCNFLKRNADIEFPAPKDEQFLADYKRQAEQLAVVAKKYHATIYQYALDAKVYFELHEPEKRYNSRKISFEEAEPLFVSNSDKIISIHCQSCDQQFDVLATNQ